MPVGKLILPWLFFQSSNIFLTYLELFYHGSNVIVTLPQLLLQGWDVFERTSFSGRCAGTGLVDDGLGRGESDRNRNPESNLNCYKKFRTGHTLTSRYNFEGTSKDTFPQVIFYLFGDFSIKIWVKLKKWIEIRNSTIKHSSGYDHCLKYKELGRI